MRSSDVKDYREGMLRKDYVASTQVLTSMF